MQFAGRRLDIIIFPRVLLAMNRVLISASWSQQRTVFANGEFAPYDLIRKSEKDKWTKSSANVKGLDFKKSS